MCMKLLYIGTYVLLHNTFDQITGLNYSITGVLHVYYNAQEQARFLDYKIQKYISTGLSQFWKINPYFLIKYIEILMFMNTMLFCCFFCVHYCLPFFLLIH